MENSVFNNHNKDEYSPAQSVGFKPQHRFYQMDLVRYFLAMSVIIAHYNVLFNCSIYWPMGSGTAVGIFFGLSGFLVYASYLRHNNSKGYLLSRLKRILPSYWFIVIFCALTFSMLSTLNMAQYFSDIHFWKYLGANMLFLNFLQPELPGVFSHNITSAVNASLWTLKVEWMLYLSIPCFFLILKRVKIPFYNAILLLLLFSVAYRQLMLFMHEYTGKEIYKILSYQFAGQLVYFYTGVACFHYRRYLFNRKLICFGLSLLILCCCRFIFTEMSLYKVTEFIYFLFFPVGAVLLSVVVCIFKPTMPIIMKIGNCSYEMYLFHFPILQCLSTSQQFNNLPHWQRLSICVTIITILSWIVNKYIVLLWNKK